MKSLVELASSVDLCDYVSLYHTEILVPTQQQFVNRFSTASITRPYKLQLGATVQLQWDGPQQHHPFCQGPQAGCKEVQCGFDWLLFWERKEASVVYDSIICRSGTIWYMHQMMKMWESQESITSEATYSVFRCWNSVMSLPLKSFEFSQMRLFATSSWCYCCFVLNVDFQATLQFLEISSCHNPCCEMFKAQNRIDVLTTGFAISWSLRWEQRRRGHFLWIGLKHMHIVHIYPPGDSEDILCHVSGLHILLYIFCVVSSYQLLHALFGMIMICYITVCK